jgi:3-hydroxyacyl-[acyl-carrier-protein] dehydratase
VFSLRFELIDRVLERTADRLVAVKNVTSAEEYLADHFPGFPVLPGVMMLETLVQAGRLLAAGRDSDPRTCDDGQPLVLAEVRNVRYGNMVRPGQTLKVEVTLRSREEGRVDLQGVGSVDEQVAVQGRFILRPASLAR